MAVTIPRFTLVEILAASSGKPTVRKWNPGASEAPALLTSPKTLGVTMTDSDFAEPLAVMRRGYLRDVAEQNAEVWAVGDLLWAKSDGSITKTRPTAPLPLVRIGTVFSGPDGGDLFVIDVNVEALPAITELSGVLVDAPADKDVLIYVAASSRYETRQIVHNTDLSGLSTAGAHPAAAISNTPAGDIAATDVQAALNELDSEKCGRRWAWAMGGE